MQSLTNMPKDLSSADAVFTEGLRDRKRMETRQRIAETGLRLFLNHGYEQTTLDAIAIEAGISRRTFFSYFKSKDDIIFAWQRDGWSALNSEILTVSPDVPPLEAVRDVILKQLSNYSAEQMIAIDKLMRSSDSLLARKQAFYIEQEQALFTTLCQVWRQPERRRGLAMVAMMSIGAMRLAIQAWHEYGTAKRPPAKFLQEAFESLKSEL